MGKATMPSNTDNKIESYLKERGVEFIFLERVPPGSFDAERSLENQARLGAPLNADVVDRYIEAAKGGDQFPPVIAYRLSSGLLEILDGNHRRAAFAELGLGMDAYVVDPATQPSMRSLITFEANTKHGLPSTDQDRLHHALFMVDNGTSVREASRMFGVPQHKLQRSTALKEATRRAEDTKLPSKKWEQLQPGIQLKLKTITTDEGFKLASELAADANMNNAAVSDLVKELNRSRSASNQRETVALWRAEYSAQIEKAATTGRATSER
jgi:hypothetical protein